MIPIVLELEGLEPVAVHVCCSGQCASVVIESLTVMMVDVVGCVIKGRPCSTCGKIVEGDLNITLNSFLTDSEIRKAANKYKEVNSIEFAAWVRDEIIVPNLERINRKLSQENNPTYLAYCVEYVMSRGFNRGEK